MQGTYAKGKTVWTNGWREGERLKGEGTGSIALADKKKNDYKNHKRPSRELNLEHKISNPNDVDNPNEMPHSAHHLPLGTSTSLPRIEGTFPQRRDKIHTALFLEMYPRRHLALPPPAQRSAWLLPLQAGLLYSPSPYPYPCPSLLPPFHPVSRCHSLLSPQLCSALSLPQRVAVFLLPARIQELNKHNLSSSANKTRSIIRYHNEYAIKSICCLTPSQVDRCTLCMLSEDRGKERISGTLRRSLMLLKVNVLTWPRSRENVEEELTISFFGAAISRQTPFWQQTSSWS